MATLKLGTETGSIVNHLYSIGSNHPEAGKGATELMWSDRRAWFVNSVSADGKSCEIELPKAVRTDNNGMSEVQHYRFERESGPCKLTLKFRYGAWYVDNGKHAYKRYSKINIRFGFMSQYHDYSF